MLLDVDEYIQEKALNLFQDFGKCVEDLKNHPAFACVIEPVKILKNLLNHYLEVWESGELQLVFFHHLTLPKDIAEHLTDFLILLLSNRINMLDPAYSSSTVKPQDREATKKTKIKWNGKQQEFAELIHALTEKGYIQMPDISVAAQSRFLDDVMDFSSSNRKSGANTANNLATYLKPISERATNGITYSYLDGIYKKRFDSIVTNLD